MRRRAKTRITGAPPEFVAQGRGGNNDLPDVLARLLGIGLEQRRFRRNPPADLDDITDCP